MNLACLFGRHDYSVVGEWRLPRPEPGALIGLSNISLECDQYVYSGSDRLRVQCDHCGKRALGRFRREIRKNLWLSTGVDVDSDPQWHVVVNPFGVRLQLAKGPTHEEILAEVGR